MNAMLVGEQIARARKALGLTQEELGKRVGVSTQAVSRWECGGAPDIALLPAIADTLHVSIDALFGREGTEAADMEAALLRWAKSLPISEFWKKSVPLLVHAAMSVNFTGGKMPDVNPSESCLVEGADGRRLGMSSISCDDGYAVASYARDMQFFAICPEPEAGYEAYFAENGAYRHFFSVLAKPGVMEILLALYREPLISFTAAAMVKRTSMSKAEAEAAMNALGEAGLLAHSTVELEDGPADTWTIHAEKPLIPFLLCARYLLQNDGFNYLMLNPRTRPWLRKEAANEKQK